MGNIKPEYQQVNYPDGGEYIGQYVDCRNGKGIYSFSNKDSYMGSWKDDKFYGDGIYIYSTGEKYQGKFQEGKKHGKGQFFYYHGVFYEGSYEND